jgi:predicted dinucleotide-binding enzyme
MSYAIVGFGKIGQALAHAFARKDIDVTVASRRPPAELEPQARAIGPKVFAKSLEEALKADTIFLAVPFGEHREVAKALPSWQGKTIIDAMNSFPLPLEELDGLPSSAFAAKSFAGAKFVSDDDDAVAPVVEVAKELGFAPVKLGKLNEGGWLVHARGATWGHLIFQDVFKKQQ